MDRYSVVVKYQNNETFTIKLKQGDKIKEKTSLERLDYVLTACENKEKFFNYIIKTFDNGLIPKDAYIKYQANKQEKKLDIIFNNSKLRNIAGNIIKRKNMGEKNVKIDTKNEYFIEVLNRIKTLSLSPISKYAISKMPYIIKQKLEEYVKMYELESNEKYDELEHITMSIKAHLSDYKVFRDTIIAISKIEKYASKNKIAEPTYKQLTLEEYNKIIEENQNKEYKEYEKELKDIAEEKKKKIEEIMKIANADTSIEEIAMRIKDMTAREAYKLTNGDIDLIIEMLGREKTDSLSSEDKFAIGINKQLIK